MNFFNRLSQKVNQTIEYLLFILGLSMALIVGTQVFCRYVLNDSLFWSEELARYLLVWLTFLGISVAYRRQVHPGVDIIYTRMSPVMRKISVIITHLASMTLFGIMIFYGYSFAYFVRLQISPALGLPKWIVLSIIPITGLILILHCLVFITAEFKGIGNDS